MKAEHKEVFEQLINQALGKCDTHYQDNESYQSLKESVGAKVRLGLAKEAWLDITRFLVINENAEKNYFSSQKVISILAEQENAVITKEQLLKLIKNENHEN